MAVLTGELRADQGVIELSGANITGAEGPAPQIVVEVMETIRHLKQHGLSIVLVEQNAKLVLDLVDDIVVLNSGHVAVDATVGALQDQGIDLHQHLGIY